MVKFSKTMSGVYVIAEVGLNHNGSLKLALDHVDKAVEAGCSAVKFQTYDTETRIQDPSSPLRALLKGLELSYDEFAQIKEHCDAADIEFFSTAFDMNAIQFLLSIGVDLFKVASFDVSNRRLISELAANANRVIFSTGMTEIAEVKQTVAELSDRIEHIGVLHCVSSYPTPNDKARLCNISTLKEHFDECVIGYSDHTTGVLAPAVSVGLGARVIEKHFKLADDFDCVDAPVSIGPADMKLLVEYAQTGHTMIGESFFGITEIEQAATQFKRTSY